MTSRKYADTKKFKPHCTVLVLANGAPHILTEKGNPNLSMDRWVIFKLTDKHKKKTEDPDFLKQFDENR